MLNIQRKPIFPPDKRRNYPLRLDKKTYRVLPEDFGGLNHFLL